MSNLSLYIGLAALVSFAFSLLGTPLIVSLCHARRLYDVPEARKLHKQSIPRLGGSLFLPSLGLGVASALLASQKHWGVEISISASSCMMMAGALLIYIIGILDDVKGLGAREKFAIQTLVACFFPLCRLQVQDLHGLFGLYVLPLWASAPLTVLLVLLVVNAMNLIDGIDGLASGLAALVLAAFCHLYAGLQLPLFCLICAALCGAVLAFFLYNVLGRAGGEKIFMGDSGSLLLGYVLAYLAVKYQMDCPYAGLPHRPEALAVSLSLLFVPCADVVRVALERKFHHQPMFHADKTHLHHRLMQAGLSMRLTLLAIISLCVLLCLMNWGLWTAGLRTTGLLLCDMALYAVFLFAAERTATQHL